MQVGESGGSIAQNVNLLCLVLSISVRYLGEFMLFPLVSLMSSLWSLDSLLAVIGFDIC